MSKDEGLLLDMLLASREIQGHLGGKAQADFHSERLLVLAVQQLLTIVGEAASQVSPEFRSAHPDIPWRAMIGQRNILIHAYAKVDLDKVWDSAREGVPALIEALVRLIPPDAGEGTSESLP